MHKKTNTLNPFIFRDRSFTCLKQNLQYVIENPDNLNFSPEEITNSIKDKEITNSAEREMGAWRKKCDPTYFYAALGNITIAPSDG